VVSMGGGVAAGGMHGSCGAKEDETDKTLLTHC
jgi:hypothetical protein